MPSGAVEYWICNEHPGTRTHRCRKHFANFTCFSKERASIALIWKESLYTQKLHLTSFCSSISLFYQKVKKFWSECGHQNSRRKSLVRQYSGKRCKVSSNAILLKIWPPVGHRVGHRIGHGLGQVLSTPISFALKLTSHLRGCPSGKYSYAR